MSLEIETKKAMEYSNGDSVCENCTVCENCIYHKEVEDMMIDRSWYSICTYCNFTVSKKGNCEKFERNLK